MKRLLCTTNKPDSLRRFASRLKSTVYIDDRYECVPNTEENTVDIYDSGRIATRYTLDKVEDEVRRYKYRRATETDIRSGVPLYVKEPYLAKVSKQIPSVRRVDSLASRYE